MKGVVFTELLEMVEVQFSLDLVDEVLDACELESGGAYTAVGTYDYQELLQIVQQLSGKLNVSAAELVRNFGEHLFSRFVENYAQFFVGVTSAFDFLKGIEDYIHVEVRKLYSDAELPKFEWSEPGDGRLNLVYSSSRPLADLAEGLIRGCRTHFGESFAIERVDLPSGRETQFELTQQV